MPDFVISFEKDKDYRRFHTSNVLTNYHRKMMVVDFIEESPPIVKSIVVPPDDESIVDRGLYDVEAIIHATVTIHPEQLPYIINSLQSLYDQFLKEEFPGGEENDGEA